MSNDKKDPKDKIHDTDEPKKPAKPYEGTTDEGGGQGSNDPGETTGPGK